MKEFTVEGKITIDVSVPVDADNEESARLLAINILNDRYNLDVYGSYHSPDKDVKLDLDVFNEEDYED